jgi:hypothetical protein
MEIVAFVVLMCKMCRGPVAFGMTMATLQMCWVCKSASRMSISKNSLTRRVYMSRFTRKLAQFDGLCKRAEWGAVIYPAFPLTFPSYNHCKRLSRMDLNGG